MGRLAGIALVACLASMGCDATTDEAPQVFKDPPLPPLSPPPAALHLDPFYAKYVDAAGIPVVSSAKVADAALLRARTIILRMTSKRDDVRRAITAAGVRVAVMAADEKTTDVPEHRDLYSEFPHGRDWDECRGVGATAARPVTSCVEENLLAGPKDRYGGENILVHEFGHTMDEMGLRRLPGSDFAIRLERACRAATEKGLWAKTYAATNKEEYWAEGVQDWFDVNLHAEPANGIHNEISTREQLAAYDPGLFALLSEVFPEERDLGGR